MITRVILWRRFVIQAVFFLFIYLRLGITISLPCVIIISWAVIQMKTRGRRTLVFGVRPSLRSKELTERWVCPFSCCEWRDHLSYPSTLPVARPGSRGGRWLSPLTFWTRSKKKKKAKGREGKITITFAPTLFIYCPADFPLQAAIP